MTKYRPDDDEFRRLVQLITQWNDDHYDIFEIAQPNENLEFHGVMRFFFQDAGAKVATKCIRVSSTATAKEVIDVLIEKFRPDMRMLTQSNYNLYEVHPNLDERKLAENELPLVIQLNWGTDMRDGRFLLKCENAITAKDEFFEIERDVGGFKRKLSKREKKEKKKRDKERLRNKENLEKDATLAEKLYTDVPENSFTRSISNPEAVMRRRRQQKVEKRLQEFRNEEGGSESGGMLKVYGEALSPNIPYKTLLVSATDTASFVVEETLEKYGYPKEEAYKYCLVQVTVPKGDREYHGGSFGEESFVQDDDYPLSILLQHVSKNETIIFQLRLRPQDDRKKERIRAVSHNDLRHRDHSPESSQYQLPYLVEIHPGMDEMDGRRHHLQLNVTEVGSEKPTSESGQYLQLFGPNIHPCHCVIAHMNGSVTVTPTRKDAETYINNRRIYETTLLQHGMLVQFGDHHVFRFCDSRSDERPSKVSRSPDHRLQNNQRDSQIRQYDPEMDAGTYSKQIEENIPRHERAREEMLRNAPNSITHSPARQPTPSGKIGDEVLPAALEFREDAQTPFLSELIPNVKCNAVQFKLAPTYTLYLAIRYRLSNIYRPEIEPAERALRLTNFINKMSSLIQQTIKEKSEDPASLAFWMANASEILNFLKQDQDIRLFSREAQDILAESVQMAFHHLVNCLHFDLSHTMPAFVNDDDSVEDDDFSVPETGYRQKAQPTLGDVLRTLTAAMNLLRRCRVNAALTIQLFSQLFHFINMWLFNLIIQKPQFNLCTRRWGIILKRRLGKVEAWAEKQGLELAADCHLCRIIQAAHLLQAPKNNNDDIANISSTCFKLNSLQIQALLQNYIPEDNEPRIPQSLIDRVVTVARNMADDLAHSDGNEIKLEEDRELQLPFLLPEDGYSCDIIRGVPNGLPDFLEAFIRNGVCRFTPQPSSKGLWTVYMVGLDQQGPRLNEIHQKEGGFPAHVPHPDELPAEPEIIEVVFEKVKGSIGLSIVAAKGDGQMSRGIYIKSVVPGGAAALDGRLQAGDQLLEVDGRSLVGLSQEKAANLMTKTGHVVRLKVSKQGAIYHGLATLLSQPSPVIPRANSPKRNGPPGPPNAYPNKGRHRSEENLNVNGMPNDMARQTPLHQGPSRDFRDMPRQGTPLQQGPPPEMARHGPPHQGPPHQGPPHQGPPHQGPPHQGPPHQGPPHQGPPHQGPPHQGPPHQGPPHQGPLYEMAHSGMPVQGSSREMPRQGMPHDMVRPGPPRQGSPRQGSPQTSSPREMSRQGPPQPGSPRNPNQGSPQYQGPPRDMIRHQGPPPPGYKKEFRDGPPRIQAHDVRPQYYTLAPQSSPSINSEGSASDPRNQKNNPNYQSRTLPQGEVMKPPPGSMQHLRDPNMSNQQDSLSNLRNPAANGPMRVNQGSPHRQQQHHLGQPFMNGGNRPGFEQRNASPNNQIPPTDPRYPGPLARSPDISKQQDPPGKAMDNRNIDPYQRIPENARQGSINKQQDPLRYSRAGPTEMVRHVQSIPDRGATYTPSPIPPYQQKGTPPLANQPPTSVHSPVNNAMKDDRPVSVAYPGSRPDRQDYSGNQLRPRSDEISTDKVREWQMKYDLDNSRNYGGLNGTEQNFNRFGNLTESPEQKVQPSHYAKIRAEPPSQEIRQDIPKASVNNQARQQHFFEKTKERMQEPAPPFHQLPKAGDQHIVKKPTVPPKKVALKPVEPIPATADIGRVNVQENHVLHQNLYNARLGPEEHLYMPPTSTATANRMAYVDHEGSYLPPPPEIPPDLPPPPAPEDLQDILPPPPPDNIKYNNYPPENVQWNQSNRYSEEFSRVDFHDNLKEGTTYQHMVPNNMNSNSHTQYTIQQNNYNRDPHANEKQFGHQGFLPSHTGPDNIVKNKSGPPLPLPPQEQPQLSSSVPYWDGDEDIDPHDINRLRELEIKKLTEMKYRQPQDEDRLRKLQLEEEFQRRVKEVGDRDDDDDDDGSEAGYSQYRVQSREWLINTMQDDLQKILNRLRQMEEDQATEEYEKEKDRMKCLRQRLEIFEKEKAEDQIRQQKRQQRKQLEQEQHLQKQREMREKQRRDIEEQRKLYLMEEEMMKERKIEELRKKKEMEKEQILATREAEEFRQQAEQKRLEEKQLQEQADRQMGRYSNISKSNISSKMYSNNTYTEHGPNLTYQTAPEKNFTSAPQPPERGSSFETLNQYQQRNFIKPLPTDQMTPDNNNMGKSVSTSALRTNQDVTAPKKSVSFNTQLETRISAAYSDDERSSNPSFRSSGEFSPNLSPSFLGNSEPSELTSKMTNEVFTQDSHQSTPPPPPTANSVEVHYRIAETPGVIGGQEIYRDPRTRIQAKKAAGSAKSPGPERMSFRDKMKYFAQEAGEGTPKEKSKASRVQRDIEYAMNGQ